MTQMNLSMTQTHRHREQTCGCQGEVASGGEGWIGSFGLADANYYIYIGWISKKVLLYGTGNYIQYLVVNYMGKE